jgi:hypothetical protein
MQATAGTIEDPNIQGHLLPMVAAMAVLRGVGRVDLDELSPSFFRFARQLTEKGRPGCITNALCQTMIVRHPVHMEVFNTDNVETVNDVTAILVSKIGASERNPFMYTRNRFTVFLSLRCAFRQFRVFTLYLCKGFFFFTEETKSTRTATF